MNFGKMSDKFNYRVMRWHKRKSSKKARFKKAQARSHKRLMKYYPGIVI